MHFGALLQRHRCYLYKRETQLLLTNCTTHLCKCNGVADLLKTCPLHICYHAEFGRPALKDVSINTIEPQNWCVLKLCCLVMGGMAVPNIHALPDMCYHVKFGSSATEGVCINRTEPTRSGSAGAPPHCVGTWLTSKTSHFPTCCNVKFGISATKGVHIMRIEPQKLGTIGPCPLGWGLIDQ